MTFFSLIQWPSICRFPGNYMTNRKAANLLLLLLVNLLLLLGCQPIQAPVTTPAADGIPTPERAPVVAQALPPVILRVPDLALELPITPMGWAVTEVNGVRTTTWIVPIDSVGWHVNSAGAGGAGNTILSGHQSNGAAVFAPLALGDIVVGQELQLVDEAGAVFRYRVREISEPIPIVGATEEDNALARTYLAPMTAMTMTETITASTTMTETVAPAAMPQLTLMTGWPDFTTTHRIFAVADYVGPGE